MSRPRLLDLFSGAGGAGMGYHRAGFEVVGVDIDPQPHYPFEFHQADALTFPLEGFDVIHASPPCQAHSALAAMHPGREWPDLIAVTRERLEASGCPWIMENVERAPLSRQPVLFGNGGVRLCGTAFSLGAQGRELQRHRLFESSMPLTGVSCSHRLPAIGVYGHGGNLGKARRANAAEAREALGIDWMNRDEMAEAIPPAYTEYLGRQILAHLSNRDRAAVPLAPGPAGMSEHEQPYEEPLRSTCCGCALVWYRKDAGRYVTAWPSDPAAARADLRCGGCNLPNVASPVPGDAPRWTAPVG